MNQEAKGASNIFLIETVIIPVPTDTNCVYCHDDIPMGKEALESPSTPNRFYHIDCFREIYFSTSLSAICRHSR